MWGTQENAGWQNPQVTLVDPSLLSQTCYSGAECISDVLTGDKEKMCATASFIQECDVSTCLCLVALGTVFRGLGYGATWSLCMSLSMQGCLPGPWGIGLPWILWVSIHPCCLSAVLNLLSVLNLLCLMHGDVLCQWAYAIDRKPLQRTFLI